MRLFRQCEKCGWLVYPEDETEHAEICTNRTGKNPFLEFESKDDLEQIRYGLRNCSLYDAGDATELKTVRKLLIMIGEAL